MRSARRYEFVAKEKAGGATYTPKPLADFVASAILSIANTKLARPIRILDPAVGTGDLLASLISRLPRGSKVEIHGFETDARVLRLARARLASAFPHAALRLKHGDFLRFALDSRGNGRTGKPRGGIGEEPSGGRRTEPHGGLAAQTYDIIIANPPYVRTQILGADRARDLSDAFALKGRVDLYHAFIPAMARVLSPRGVAGIILSNRFMTTRSGAPVRRAIRAGYRLRRVWDLGDTRLFGAAVLPAVLLAEGREAAPARVPFTSIYATSDPSDFRARSALAALRREGVAALADGRRFRVRRGTLDASEGPAGVWRIANEETDAWLATVDAHTWKTFGQVGKIRVGVKTCADAVFIGTRWNDMPLEERPELLRPLITHHVARAFRAREVDEPRRILYPHETVRGRRRPVPLEDHPKARAYLEKHRKALEGRRYVIEAGRLWYEIWVPQDPSGWSKPKLVFRDIADRPCFWMDLQGSIVNGDCYWMTAEAEDGQEVLWLAAAVANSTFIGAFYDRRFANKLYGGRRRFITQYVETFPLPDPETAIARRIISAAKAIYATPDGPAAERLRSEADALVWRAFGLGRTTDPRGRCTKDASAALESKPPFARTRTAR